MLMLLLMLRLLAGRRVLQRRVRLRVLQHPELLALELLVSHQRGSFSYRPRTMARGAARWVVSIWPLEFQLLSLLFI
jgi:hypothetical protein